MIKAVLVSTLAWGGLWVTVSAHAEQPVKTVITDPVYTRPAHLVDVGGGRRINLDCRGQGSPAVIFDSGMSDTTVAWALVQPAISRSHATCSYDRAGLGFSDASTRPSTASNDVDDIRRALRVVGIKPPYVLVGHSSGGMAVRVFADRYRDEVVGMVLVDPSDEDQNKRLDALDVSEGRAPRTKGEVDRTCLDAAKGGRIPRTSPDYASCVGERDARFSDAINDAIQGFTASLKYQAAYASEQQNFGTASADQTRATRRDFGAMPIVVLSAPYPRLPRFTQQQYDTRYAVKRQVHAELAAMSRRGVNEMVLGTSHLINFDRPDTVIDAIRRVLSAADEQGLRPAP